MVFTAAKITKLPLRNSIAGTSNRSDSLHHLHTSPQQFPVPSPKRCISSALRINTPKRSQPTVDAQQDERRFLDRDEDRTPTGRFELRLKNLGSVDEGEEHEERGFAFPASIGDKRLGDLLRREWVQIDSFTAMDGQDGEDDMVLPWDREEEIRVIRNDGVARKIRVKPPTVAELTLEDEELRRLRGVGMFIKKTITIPKAGLTKEVMEKIHEKWRKDEVVRLKFHEVLARDMKTAHSIVERRTGGLVIWRSGSFMMVYRGANYEGPESEVRASDSSSSTPEKTEAGMNNPVQQERLSVDEVEYNNLLDGLGPRFLEWWGTGAVPVDADLLPEKIPGYKTPFRFLPTKMRIGLTNAEMTNIRKLAKSLPCHFALGRNRNLQGLAAAIVKLWDKSLVAKIAIKRGVQDTNNKLMAAELKMLTGGMLLLRNKYFIIIYRGKDFVPPDVAVALSEREEMNRRIQEVEEKARATADAEEAALVQDGEAVAGTLAEFYEAQARWGRDVSAEERKKMAEEASKSKTVRLVKQVERKLALAQIKKRRAEELLSKIEASMIPARPDYDQETITDEERIMHHTIGLKMKPYLPLGTRGVFAGIIENMHLHWKFREVVKLISKQKTLAFVEETARLLEYESGGILVSIDRIPKGYLLMYYRGKNYEHPTDLRPKNLLTKAKALKRAIAMQRHEAFSEHITELEQKIEQMKREIGPIYDTRTEDGFPREVSESLKRKDEDSLPSSSEEDEEENQESSERGKYEEENQESSESEDEEKDEESSESDDDDDELPSSCDEKDEDEDNKSLKGEDDEGALVNSSKEDDVDKKIDEGSEFYFMGDW